MLYSNWYLCLISNRFMINARQRKKETHLFLKSQYNSYFPKSCRLSPCFLVKSNFIFTTIECSNEHHRSLKLVEALQGKGGSFWCTERTRICCKYQNRRNNQPFRLKRECMLWSRSALDCRTDHWSFYRPVFYILFRH